jgi:hypothetical protein
MVLIFIMISKIQPMIDREDEIEIRNLKRNTIYATWKNEYASNKFLLRFAFMSQFL